MGANTLDGSPIGGEQTPSQSEKPIDAAEVLYGEDSTGEEGDASTLGGYEGDTTDPSPDGDEVPEGSYNLKLPEGVIVNTEMRGQFESIAKENNLTQAQAQRLADLHLKSVRETFQQHETDLTARVNEVLGWQKELRAMPNREAVISDAKWVMSQLGTPQEIQQLKIELNKTGLGDNPTLIRGLSRLAAKLRGTTRQPSQPQGGAGSEFFTDQKG
jgi:hypothetical protein